MNKATATARTASAWHSFERDVRHDWDGWSQWERLAVRALAVSSMLFAAFYLGLSALTLG